jgi:hypothetical protein
MYGKKKALERLQQRLLEKQLKRRQRRNEEREALHQGREIVDGRNSQNARRLSAYRG